MIYTIIVLARKRGAIGKFEWFNIGEVKAKDAETAREKGFNKAKNMELEIMQVLTYNLVDK